MFEKLLRMITMDERIIELLRRGKQILHKEGSLSFLKQVLLFFVYLMNKVFRKIAKKFLLIPQVDWMVERILRCYETIQVEKELDMLNRKREVRLNFRHYLPDTEERIERLRRVINKRPVAIILHGPSATELEERITELKDCDICYATVNVFRPIEKHILQKINRNLSLILCATTPGAQMNDIIDFFERREDNIFISIRDSLRPLKRSQGFDLDKFIKKYDKKLLFFKPTKVKDRFLLPYPYISTTTWGVFIIQAPSIEYPLHFLRLNSFSVLLSLAVIGGASMVVVFGGDGGRINRGKLYYREYGQGKQDSVVGRNLMTDTRIFKGTIIFNAAMPFMLEKIHKIYNLRPVDIVNCSVQSHYTPFRKLSYDETFALLKSFKKDTG